MENRKRLHRKCVNCGRILPVDNLGDWNGAHDDRYDNTVRWTDDPYAAEINEDYTKMWLCGRCYQESADEI